MRLVIVLPLRNQTALDNFLKELYDSASPSYRRLPHGGRVHRDIWSHPGGYDTLRSWAETNGFTVVATSRNRLNLDVTGSVAAIESAFHLNMGLYQHPTEKRTFYAPDREPTADLPFPLWHVAGLDNYSIRIPLRKEDRLRKSEWHHPRGSSFPSHDGLRPRRVVPRQRPEGSLLPGNSLTGSGHRSDIELAGTNLQDLDTYYANVNETNTVPIPCCPRPDRHASAFIRDCDDTEQTIDMTRVLGSRRA